MLVTQVRLEVFFLLFPLSVDTPGFSLFSFSPCFFPPSQKNKNNQIFLHDPDHNMVEICNCGLIPVVPVQEGRSAL